MTKSGAKTILLVEDEMIIALTEKRQLEKEGYLVIHASSGEEAIACCERENKDIDLVLMDIDLGEGMDGTEAASQILASGMIPIIFVSSHAEKDIIRKTESIASYGYVIKNSDITVLDATIKMAFRLYQANQELIDSQSQLSVGEARFKSLFTRMLEGFALHEILVDEAGNPVDYRFLDINPAFERMTGLVHDSTVGKTVLELLPGTEQYWIEKYGQVALQGTTESFESYSAVLNRHYQVVAFSPVRGQFAVICSDVTDRKKALDLVSESERKFRDLVYGMEIGVILQGPKAEMLLCNPKALELLGLSEEQLLRTTSFDPLWNVIHEDGSSFPGSDHPVPQAIATAKPVHDVIMGVYRPRHDDRIWISVDAEPKIDDEGKVEQVVCTFIDVSERKLAEEKVQNLLQEKELILKEVHHRVKNNMNTIYGLLTLQANLQDDPKTKSILVDSACRIQSMMVLYDKLYRSDNTGTISVKDYLPALVSEIFSVFPNRKSISLNTRIEDIILPARILSSLGIVFNELITNSMKYAFNDRTHGTITITAERTDGAIVFGFQDDGIGLDQSVSLTKSTGFGIQLINGLVQQMHGAIAIERDGGTRFIITLEDAHE